MAHFRAGAFGVCMVFFMALAGLAGWPRTWLTVRDAGDLRYAFLVQEDSRFSLAWTHSVEKENWVETFGIDDHAIVLISTRFKTFGAGVPANAGRDTRFENGWVVMDAIDRVVDPLAVQAASAEHYRMRYAGRWFSLAQAGEAPILTFAVRRGAAIGMWAGIVGAWRAADTGKP
jgi:hypothetical protein